MHEARRLGAPPKPLGRAPLTPRGRRVRDAGATAAGWRILRITSRRLEREPRALAAQLALLLAA